MSAKRGARSAASAATESKHVCPHYHAAVELIGRRWTGAILYALADEGPLHFAELKECVPGMSDRLLSARLKELESSGLVRREVEEGPRVRVSYELTEKGESLKPVLGAVKQWAQRWQTA
ncbi:MAG TPA: helix-turn-helix domain-containing protein [Solirubrobacterales bacterium]|nr:helix-turn-helix domain-containing protein [Solirubrobacterales bacterium]